MGTKLVKGSSPARLLNHERREDREDTATDELTGLVRAAARGDVGAFTKIVERFQDMAVGYAYSILGDFHEAEDVAQEAILASLGKAPCQFESEVMEE